MIFLFTVHVISALIFTLHFNTTVAFSIWTRLSAFLKYFIHCPGSAFKLYTFFLGNDIHDLCNAPSLQAYIFSHSMNQNIVVHVYKFSKELEIHLISSSYLTIPTVLSSLCFAHFVLFTRDWGLWDWFELCWQPTFVATHNSPLCPLTDSAAPDWPLRLFDGLLWAKCITTNTHTKYTLNC